MNRKYITTTDILPNNGLVYVDTSALTWVAPDGFSDENLSRERKLATFSRLKGFNNVFRKRGHVLTSWEILNKIDNSIKHYKNMRKNERKIRKESKSYSRGRKFPLTIGRNQMKNTSNWLKEWNRMYNILEEGIIRYGLDDPVLDYQEVSNFVGRLDSLSDAKKSLVSMALLSGSGNGILTADVPLITKYEEGVGRFDLQQCSVSNAIAGKTYSIR